MTAQASAQNAVLRRQRGLALELIYTEFKKKGVHYDHISLCENMQALGQTVYYNDVIFILRQLKDRGYLAFNEMVVNRSTGELLISEIRITSAGQDIVEHVASDPAVLILL